MQSECETYRKHASEVKKQAPAVEIDYSDELANYQQKIQKLQLDKKSLKDQLASETQSTTSAYQSLTLAKVGLA